MSRRKKPTILENFPITAYAAEGKSLGHDSGGRVVFVPGAVPGDIVDVRLGKTKKAWAEATLTKLVEPSPDRIPPFCPHFGTCGGCKWQMLPYQKQLDYKAAQAAEQLRRISGLGESLPPLRPILPSPAGDRYYRNKLEFTFSATRYRSAAELSAADGADLPREHGLGFHAPGLFDKVVPIHTCLLQPEPTNAMLHVLRTYTEAHGLSYYDHRAHTGFLRTAVLRVSTNGEVLLNIVFGAEDEAARTALLDHLWTEVPGLSSLHYTVNTKMNDTIYDLPVHLYRGTPTITETLEDFRFTISPKSFFQTNTRGAEALYRLVREGAALSGREVVYDLYCGTGSIGIFLSAGARKIIGVEAVEDAVEDARKNAAVNGLSAERAQFFAGDAARVCTPEFWAEHGAPDVVITDPPRAGMSEALIGHILQTAAPRVVYVSCNPATMARDLALLHPAYRIESLQPVDLFPQTHHVECVAVLVKEQ